MAIDHGDIHLQQVNSIGSTASERDRSERIQEGMKLLDQRLVSLLSDPACPHSSGSA